MNEAVQKSSSAIEYSYDIKLINLGRLNRHVTSKPLKMKKLAFLFLTSLCIIGCQTVDRTENLQTKVDSLKMENDSLAKLINGQKPETNYWFHAQYDGGKLIKSGVENPEEFIENSLRENTELIPLKPVLGGTMNFGKVQILSSEWLIASFDDGHVEGRAIYKYKLNDKGELEFELLNAMLP